jgi:hypothetical protein
MSSVVNQGAQAQATSNPVESDDEDSHDEGRREAKLRRREEKLRRREEKLRRRKEILELWKVPRPADRARNCFISELMAKESGLEHEDAYLRWSAFTPHERAPYHVRFAKETAQDIADLATYDERMPLSPSEHSTDVDSNLSDENEVDRYRRYDEACRRTGVQKWNRYRRDHPRACGGALLPVPDQPFRFLDLPPELREKIYAMVVGCEKEIYQINVNETTPGKDGSIDVRIFAVSRQVFAEARSIFFKINTILVRINIPVRNENRGFLRNRSTGMEVPRPTVYWKRVHLWIYLLTTITKRRTENALKTLCERLKMCEHLLALEITAVTLREEENDMKHQHFDRIFELLAEIKPVDRVVFTDQESIRGRVIRGWVIMGTPEQAARAKQIMENKPIQQDVGNFI